MTAMPLLTRTPRRPQSVRRTATSVLVLVLFLGGAVAGRRAGPTNPLARLENVRRVLFLGDSITYAGPYVEDIEVYYLTRFPDRHFEFINVGLSSETVSGLSEPGHAGGKYARPDLHERLGRILDKLRPDLVFICYGMNDGIYQPFSDAHFNAFQEGMKSVRQQVAATGAKIIHVTPPVFDPVQARTTNAPPYSFGHAYAGYNEVLDRFSDWLMAQRSAGWDVVDLHGAMNRWLAGQRQRNPQFSFTRDGVHPDAAGHWVMAKQILLFLGATDVESVADPAALAAGLPRGGDLLPLVHQRQEVLRDAWLTETGHKRPGVKPGLPLVEALARAADLDQRIHELTGPATAPFPGVKSQWQGFDRYDFEVDGTPAIVVAPKQSLPGKPWIWRGEFFGVYAKADAALVGKGFHLAYLRVPDLFGNPEAVAKWNGFYRELTGKYGFARKVALIGLSRGGLYCYNWAIANPNKVACIYGDAPVCDLKSWPGGKLRNLGKGDGNAAEWPKMLKAYGFKSEADVVAFKGNPVDNLKPLADARIPLLNVYGDADTTAPWDENTGLLAERYRQLGWSITLIPKPGAGHHPHGLTDPTPIVEFILKYAAPSP